ncbi:MAG: hypothetical protein AB7G47_02065 [Mycolicibacterium sp.]|uniref:hypothetical protein n=1 Tax=Mycolicibacterium sp. TaxID=2320850 RepID=UPI003D1449A8
MSRIAGLESNTRTPQWIPLLAAFTLVVGFTYSDDIVEFTLDYTGWRFGGARVWLVFALDCVLVLGTLVAKWLMGGANEPGEFRRQVVIGKWGLGAALVVSLHLVLIVTEAPRAGLGKTAALWIALLFTLLFVAAMALLLVSVLSGPSDRPGNNWVLPLVVGVFVAQLVSALWHPVIQIDTRCAIDVASAYFSAVTLMQAIVLLNLGRELSDVRRRGAVLNVGQQILPALTVLMLVVSILLALSMLLKSDTPACGLAAVWHEYIALVFTVQSTTTGLITLLWMMLFYPDAVPSGRRDDETPSGGQR